MKKFFSKSLAVAAFALLGASTSMSVSASTVVTFDSADGNFNLSYTESGFTFVDSGNGGDNGIAHWSPAGNNTPSYAFCSNGYGCGNGASISITSAGGAFSFDSFDGSNYDGVAQTGTFQVVGALAGGGTVTDTFTYGPTWSNYSISNLSDVIKVTFTSTGTYASAIDNLTFDAPTSVPEPESLALVGLGLAGLGFMRRKAKKA